MRAVVATIVLLGVPRIARAYRPFDQTDADTAEVDTIELELGPVKLTSGDGHVVYGPGGVLNDGFADQWELVFDYDASIPLADVGSSLVLTDLMIKHVLRPGSLQDRPGPSVAVELGPLLPTLPTMMHSEIGGSAAVIVSQRLPGMTIHVNGQIEWTRDRAVSTTGGAIFEGPLSWRLRPVAELYVSNERGANLYSGLVGAIWRWRATIVFDAALRVFRDDQNDTATQGELRVGLTWVIPT